MLHAHKGAETSIVILPTPAPPGELASGARLRRSAYGEGYLWERARELDNIILGTTYAMWINAARRHHDTQIPGKPYNLCDSPSPNPVIRA